MEHKYNIIKAKEVKTYNDWDKYCETLSTYGKEVGINNLDNPFLSILIDTEYKNIVNEIDEEFKNRININNELDLKFLRITIVL